MIEKLRGTLNCVQVDEVWVLLGEVIPVELLLSGGVANGESNTNGTYCECNPGFDGGGQINETSLIFDLCLPVNCPNGTIASDSRTCVCNVGFSGSGEYINATDAFPVCDEEVCPNGVVSIDRARCDCLIGYGRGGRFLSDKERYPLCREVTCENGRISEDKHTCECSEGFNGGGLFNDVTDSYLSCQNTSECIPSGECGDYECGHVSDSCSGKFSCGQCPYGSVCATSNKCALEGLCVTVIVNQTNGGTIGNWTPWSPDRYGDVYHRKGHWAGRPYFESTENGWNTHTYLYWYTGIQWPASLEVGWYISGTLGGSDPLAYLPERIPVPIDNAAVWRVKNYTSLAFVSDRAITSFCGPAESDRVTDYHMTPESVTASAPWYHTANPCLLESQTGCVLRDE